MFPKLMQDLMVVLDIDEHLTVSFNASAKDFMDDRFTRLMLELIEQAKVPPKSLQVELSELFMPPERGFNLSCRTF
jgi:sensor c-di-GMP phosphodiesterase-like protein